MIVAWESIRGLASSQPERLRYYYQLKTAPKLGSRCVAIMVRVSSQERCSTSLEMYHDDQTRIHRIGPHVCLFGFVHHGCHALSVIRHQGLWLVRRVSFLSLVLKFGRFRRYEPTCLVQVPSPGRVGLTAIPLHTIDLATS